MSRTQLLAATLAGIGSLLAQDLPKVAKDHPRGTLEGYERLHVYPEIQFRGTLPPPIEIEWRLGPDLPLPVKGGVAGVLANHLVVVPGIGFRPHDAVVQALDLASGTWTRLPDVPKAPVYTTGVRVRDSIIVLSGRGGSKVAPEVGPAVQRLRRRDGAWVWDELPPLPRQTWYANAAAVDDRWIVIANGVVGRPSGANPTEQDTVSRDVWVFDLDHPDRPWQTLARYEHALLTPALGGFGGKVYFLGGSFYYPWLRREHLELGRQGFQPWSNGYVRQKLVYALDLGTRRWERCADLPYERSSGVALPYRGRYLLDLGGSSHSADHRSVRRGTSREGSGTVGRWRGHHDEVFVYDAQKRGWSVLDRPMPYGVNDPQAVLDGDTVYVLGGEPDHGFNFNTEDVVMVGTIRPTSR
jgi:hypothetical protein